MSGETRSRQRSGSFRFAVVVSECVSGLNGVELALVVEVEARDDPEQRPPQRLRQNHDVGVHGSDDVVPREHVVRHVMTAVQEDTVHACPE